MRFGFRVFVAVLLLGFATGVPVSAATFTVTNTNDAGAGSLRAAIADANAAPGAGSIVFDAGLSGATITLTSAQLQIIDALAIDASGLAGGLTVSGGNALPVFAVNGTAATLNGFTITQGAGTFSTAGSAITNNNGNLTLQNMRLANSTSGTEAAVLNLGGYSRSTTVPFGKTVAIPVAA